MSHVLKSNTHVNGRKAVWTLGLPWWTCFRTMMELSTTAQTAHVTRNGIAAYLRHVRKTSFLQDPKLRNASHGGHGIKDFKVSVPRLLMTLVACTKILPWILVSKSLEILEAEIVFRSQHHFLSPWPEFQKRFYRGNKQWAPERAQHWNSHVVLMVTTGPLWLCSWPYSRWHLFLYLFLIHDWNVN